MTLNDADIGMEYKVRNINAEDEEMVSFLFSLGCYSGEPITVVSKKRSGLVVSIKDGRYNMDKDLSSAIEIA
ncbi:MAG: ferrous iron transport protein A [Butyrivibrio sp.]|nr:ferrous iron transport protein A [Muribaculum sp.]MCM1552948.1 ferrous iron transport protein A [Butyrivibrio sp.]